MRYLKVSFIFILVLLLVKDLDAQNLTGTKNRFTMHSQALEGNLIGDSPDREVSIYLPPSYQKNDDRRYPVLYMLHGFTDRDDKWFGFQQHWINLPAIADSAISQHNSREMIIVMPNAYNSFKGSMYSSSVTIGDWETFVTRELVDYVDTHFRTLAGKESRGLAGHSMGGYGTMRLAMKYPEVFGSIYLLSPCCMGSNVNDNAGLIKNTLAVTTKEQLEEQPFFVSATLASAAAWAPNPKNAPLYLDLPYKDDAIDQKIADKIAANATLSVLDQYIFSLKKLNAIAMDAGEQDFGISGTTRELHERLENYDISHFYESYQGDHLNKIAERIYQKVLPFFSKNLKFTD
jgi:enterochelin esterase-like enzyme